MGDTDRTCMEMDRILYNVNEKINDIVQIYLVDFTEVTDFTSLYSLYDPCTIMFFFRGKHVHVDVGSGNTTKLNWPVYSEEDICQMVQIVYNSPVTGKDTASVKWRPTTITKFSEW